MVAPRSRSVAAAVMPTEVPAAEFSTTVLGVLSVSLMAERALSLTPVMSMVIAAESVLLPSLASTVRRLVR